LSYSLYIRITVYLHEVLSMIKSLLIVFLSVFFSANTYSQSRTLDYYLQQGSNNCPLLKDYANQLQSGSIDSLLAIGAYKPQVNLTSQAMYAPAGNNIGYDEAITNGGNYAAVIGVKQSLFNEKIKSAQLQNIRLLKQSLGVNKTITLTDLKKSITFQYITAYADYEELQFNLKMTEMLAEQQKGVKYLVEAGIYQQIDFMNLEVSGKALEITYKQAFIQYKNDIALLNLVSGIVDTSMVNLEKPALELTNHFDILQSPAMLQSGIDSLKNSNAKSLVDLNYKPKLEAFADAGFMAIKPLNVPHNFGTSFGLNLSIPIYDGQLRIQEYNKIEIAEKSRTLFRDFYTSQYWQQCRQLKEQLKLTGELIAEINAQLSQQNELIGMYKAEIEKGLVRFTDFLLVINNYITTQNSLAVAEMNRMQLINQLNYLK